MKKLEPNIAASFYRNCCTSCREFLCLWRGLEQGGSTGLLSLELFIRSALAAEGHTHQSFAERWLYIPLRNDNVSALSPDQCHREADL
jgi:hypothetical protein